MQKILTLETIHRYTLAFLVSSLSVTVMLKVGEIQYLELFLVADCFLVFALFSCNSWKVKVFRPFWSLAIHYITFIAFAFFLGVLALQQDFYPFSNEVLKRPLLLTIARIVELVLDVFFMLYLASLYREDERLCRFGAKTYYYVGVLGSVYGLLTYPLNVIYGLQLGTYSDSHRIRGFNNEGGPYGTYLISVYVLSIAMYQKKWLRKKQLYWSMALFLVCLIGSQSKAAFFAMALLVLINLMWTLKGWKLWTLLSCTCLLFISIAYVVNLQDKIDVYARASATYQKYSLMKSEDANYVMGRVSGAVLAPRMIATHPWLGVGWGNYPLVRDDPQYRQGTAFSINAIDSPGLGPIDYIVELGLPLWMYMTWIAIRPVYLLRKHGASIWIVSMALMQPISNWCGAHLNLIYPWVVVALALGMGYSKVKSEEARPLLVQQLP